MRTDAFVSPFYLLACALGACLLLPGTYSHAQESPLESPLELFSPPRSSVAVAQASPAADKSSATPTLPLQLPDLTKRENFGAAMQIIIMLTVLSLAPAILIMMTSFTRIIIVMSLLRQALGTQQLPPNQVLIGLSMFMTFLVMGPTWQRRSEERRVGKECV